MSIVVGSDGSTALVLRTTSTSQSFIFAPSAGTGPGSCQGTELEDRFMAKGVTPPHLEPTYACTPAGKTMPFCVAATARLMGCHRSGSMRGAPGPSKTSGGFTTLYSAG